MRRYRGKYGARKTTCRAGHLHDSMREAHRCNELQLLQKAKQISELQFQVPFTLQDGFKLNGRAIRAIKYYADFAYLDRQGIPVYEDTKGIASQVYLLKKKLLLKKLADENEQFIFIET